MAIRATITLGYAALISLLAAPSHAVPFFFSTGNVDGNIAIASRPQSTGKIEIEAGDDFVTASQTWIRDTNLSPDWLKVGTDIMGGSPAPTFRAFPEQVDLFPSSPGSTLRWSYIYGMIPYR